VQGYEGDVPGENTNLDLNVTAPMREALESCQTLTSSGYGFQRHNHHYRPPSELMTMLLRSAAAGANFLLNVGPSPDGEVARPARDRLAQLGAWLRVNGEGVYGTRAGRLTLSDPASDPPAITGAATTVNLETGTHYIHLFDGRAPTTIYAELPAGEHADTARATLLHDGDEVDVAVRGDGDTLVITVPAERRGGLATTVRVEVA
jgi:alpha-L-fucosidase